MKKIVLFLACGLLIGNIVLAQSALKIGYVNSATLLQAMPEKAKADSDLSKYAKSFQDQIDIMMKEYQTKAQAYQASEKTMTDAMKEVKAKEIQGPAKPYRKHTTKRTGKITAEKARSICSRFR